MRGKKDVTTFPDKPVSWIASLFRGLNDSRNRLVGKCSCVLFSSHNIYIYICSYIYIYIYINELLIELSSVNKGNEPVSSYLHRNKALLRNSWTKYLNLPPHLLCKFYSVSSMVTNILSIKIPWRMIWSRNRLVEKNLGLCFFSLAQFISRCTSMHQAL